MKITLNIPCEFCKHYLNDKFKDSLCRIKEDVKDTDYKGLSGNYEIELLEMLITAFEKSGRSEA